MTQAMPNDFDFNPPILPPAPPPPCLTDFHIVGDQVGALFSALGAAQLEFASILKDEKADVVPKDGKRPYSYKYSTLQGTIEATRSALNKQGLAFLQPFTVRDGICVVRTIVAHGSGTYLEAISSFDATQEEGYMTRWQLLGSAISYCRRYSCQAMLGVAPSEDDDGASAPSPAPRSRQEPPKPPTPQKAQPKPSAPILAPPAQPIPHDKDGVVPAEDSPEAIAADEPVALAPKGDDASYTTDDQARTAFNIAFKAARLSPQQVKRYLHQTYNILPDKLSTMTVAICREATKHFANLPPCACPPEEKFCSEKGRVS